MSRSIETLSRRFPGKRAIVTGAASGLGLEICKLLASGGWRIGLFDIQEQALEQAARLIREQGGTPITARVDVTNPQNLSQATREFAAQAGGVDLFVNNAGVAVGGTFLETPVEDWSWVVGINLMGVVHGCAAALPLLKQANQGVIINVASAAGFVSSPAMSAYNATKAAVISLSETLFGELLDSPIQVSVAMPAFFKTNLLDRLRAPKSEMESATLLMKYAEFTAEQAAEMILAGAAKGDFYIFVPPKLKTLWRFKRFLPLKYLKSFPRMRDKRIAALRAKN
ncbi:MAG: SDR family NAD(P)-dependent oxidoreductase [Blastocatellia bacterium]|nr:SDR family NAD(P)-dependent oxidoreductase [Blastocatellia bacterium]